MLQIENRLKKVRDFNLLVKQGFWVQGNFIDLKILDLQKIKTIPKKEEKNKFKIQLKIAFAVGIKISKIAVKRNRIKRQMREVVRLLIKEEKIKQGYYLLFVPKKTVLEKDYLELEKEVVSLLKKSKLFII